MNTTCACSSGNPSFALAANTEAADEKTLEPSQIDRKASGSRFHRKLL